jgi:hypothetical protein
MLSIAGVIAFAVFFYRAGEFENDGSPGLLWTVLSLAVSLLTLWLRMGLMGLLFGQICLYLGITLYRVNRKE